jgi:hypothetical protein
VTDLAPVALFIFNRADHLRRTIESLKQCDEFRESRVIVFGDGPRNSDENPAVEHTRSLARAMLGPDAEYHFRDSNAGLSRSVIDGVTDAVTRFGRVIVVEDDLEVSRNFLHFLNAALSRYDQNQEVFQVSGHMFDAPKIAERGAAVFLPFTTTWGWATWRRAWDRFDPTAQGWERLYVDEDLRRRFNLRGCYDYSTMLERQMAGLRDSWGVRWYWSVFRNGGAACFPPFPLVRNIGFDGSGTHGRGVLRRFKIRRAAPPGGAIEFPADVAISEEDFGLVRQAIWEQNGGWLGATADRLRRRLHTFRRGHS